MTLVSAVPSVALAQAEVERGDGLSRRSKAHRRVILSPMCS